MQNALEIRSDDAFGCVMQSRFSAVGLCNGGFAFCATRPVGRLAGVAANSNHAPTGREWAVTSGLGIDLLQRIVGLG